ncbi:hypothetical protein Barb6_02556 [Bacteroidales bacterium Barb6]|nr:hypothetical protein Barb6_02556 [Bacteroidales bacterium Barb6]
MLPQGRSADNQLEAGFDALAGNTNGIGYQLAVHAIGRGYNVQHVRQLRLIGAAFFVQHVQRFLRHFLLFAQVLRHRMVNGADGLPADAHIYFGYAGAPSLEFQPANKAFYLRCRLLDVEDASAADTDGDVFRFAGDNGQCAGGVLSPCHACQAGCSQVDSYNKVCVCRHSVVIFGYKQSGLYISG